MSWPLTKLGVTDHAVLRAAQRMAVPPTREDWLRIVLEITGREAPLLSVVPDARGDREVYLCRLGGELVRVIWVPIAALIVTVYPDALARRRHAKRSLSRGHTKAVPRRATAIRWDAWV